MSDIAFEFQKLANRLNERMRQRPPGRQEAHQRALELIAHEIDQKSHDEFATMVGEANGRLSPNPMGRQPVSVPQLPVGDSKSLLSFSNSRTNKAIEIHKKLWDDAHETVKKLANKQEGSVQAMMLGDSGAADSVELNSKLPEMQLIVDSCRTSNRRRGDNPEDDARASDASDSDVESLSSSKAFPQSSQSGANQREVLLMRQELVALRRALAESGESENQRISELKVLHSLELKNTLEKHEHENTRLRQHIAQLLREQDSLNAALDDERTKSSQLAENVASMRTLADELAAVKSELDNCQELLYVEQSRRSQVETQCKEVEAKLAEAEERLRDPAHDDLNGSIYRSDSGSAFRSGIFSPELTRRIPKEILDTSVIIPKAQYEVEKTELLRAVEEREGATRELTSLKDRMNEFERSVRDEVRDHVTEVEEHNEQLLAERGVLSEENHALCTELSDLKRKFKEFEVQRGQTTVMIKTIDSLRRELNTTHVAYTRLRKQHSQRIFENAAFRIQVAALRATRLDDRVRDLEEQNEWLYKRLHLTTARKRPHPKVPVVQHFPSPEEHTLQVPVFYDDTAVQTDPPAVESRGTMSERLITAGTSRGCQTRTLDSTQINRDVDSMVRACSPILMSMKENEAREPPVHAPRTKQSPAESHEVDGYFQSPADGSVYDPTEIDLTVKGQKGPPGSILRANPYDYFTKQVHPLGDANIEQTSRTATEPSLRPASAKTEYPWQPTSYIVGSVRPRSAFAAPASAAPALKPSKNAPVGAWRTRPK